MLYDFPSSIPLFTWFILIFVENLDYVIFRTRTIWTLELFESAESELAEHWICRMSQVLDYLDLRLDVPY